MHAAVLTRYGHHNIVFEAHEEPEPAPGEVRVSVMAASINPADWHKAAGVPYLMRMGEGIRRPSSDRVGTDGAGVVEAVGPGVTQFSVGDRVFGSFKGSFATHALASIDRIAQLPDSIGFEEAAGLPIAGVTALEAIDRADVTGRRVVINGASGGVGTFAVQLAQCAGAAEVVAVCSGKNRALMEDLGVDRVVDYETEDFTQQPFDVLIDCVGTKSSRAVRRGLSKNGTWILLGSLNKRGLFGPLRHMLVPILLFAPRRQTFQTFIAAETTERLERLADHVAAGRLRTVIDRIVVLDVVTGAFDYLETGRARGKVLILPTPVAAPTPVRVG